MTSANNSLNNMSLRSLLEKDKLNGANFLDWHRNLRIVLRHEEKSHVIEAPLEDEPPPTATAAAKRAWEAKDKEQSSVACLMLATMSSDLQKGFEFHKAYEMLQELKTMFQVQAKQELYDTVKLFHACKMEENQSVSSHVLKMKSYLDQLERLGSPMPQELAVSLILNSLPKSYDSVVLNYNMHGMDKSVSELHIMLKTAERSIPKKTQPVLTIREGGIKKKTPQNPGKNHPPSGKGKAKQVVAKPAWKPKVKENPAKDATCHHCGEVGHWRRNCPKYLAELRAGKAGQTSTPGIFHIIELFAFSSNSWVLDTGCGTHIVNNVQGMRRSRLLNEGDLDLFVGNGARAAVKAIGTYDLILPNDFSITLDNCYFAPSITRNVTPQIFIKEEYFILDVFNILLMNYLFRRYLSGCTCIRFDVKDEKLSEMNSV